MQVCVKIVKQLIVKSRWLFSQITPSKMFDRVLNMAFWNKSLVYIFGNFQLDQNNFKELVKVSFGHFNPFM